MLFGVGDLDHFTVMMVGALGIAVTEVGAGGTEIE